MYVPKPRKLGNEATVLQPFSTPTPHPKKGGRGERNMRRKTTTLSEPEIPETTFASNGSYQKGT